MDTNYKGRVIQLILPFCLSPMLLMANYKPINFKQYLSIMCFHLYLFKFRYANHRSTLNSNFTGTIRNIFCYFYLN